MGGLQSTSSCKYELRDAWSRSESSYCWSAAGFRGCAWWPASRINNLCSYVEDTQSFTYFPNAAPVSQTVYIRDYTDASAPQREVFACPTEDNRYIEITVSGPVPTCLCRFSKVTYTQTGATLCYTDFGRARVSCCNDPFQDSPWNVIKMDANPRFFIDHSTILFAGVGAVAALLGIVLQRKLKAYRDADRDKEEMAVLYTMLEDADETKQKA